MATITPTTTTTTASIIRTTSTTIITRTTRTTRATRTTTTRTIRAITGMTRRTAPRRRRRRMTRIALTTTTVALVTSTSASRAWCASGNLCVRRLVPPAATWTLHGYGETYWRSRWIGSPKKVGMNTVYTCGEPAPGWAGKSVARCHFVATQGQRVIPAPRNIQPQTSASSKWYQTLTVLLNGCFQK